MPSRCENGSCLKVSYFGGNHKHPFCTITIFEDLQNIWEALNPLFVIVLISNESWIKLFSDVVIF